MPQQVHDVASILQIAFAAVAVIGLSVGFVFRQSLAQWVADRLRGIPLDAPGDSPPLTIAQIRKVLGGFGELMAASAVQKWVLVTMEMTRALRPKADPAAGTRYTLDWRSFFRHQGSDEWKMCAAAVSQKLLQDGYQDLTHLAVLSWPRDDANTTYESFTRPLVELLGGKQTIRVDHVSGSHIQQGLALPSFEGVTDPKVVVFEPMEVSDGFLEKAVGHLIDVHGCDIKALVTFFRTTGEAGRPVCRARGIPEICLINLNLVG